LRSLNLSGTALLLRRSYSVLALTMWMIHFGANDETGLIYSANCCFNSVTFCVRRR